MASKVDPKTLEKKIRAKLPTFTLHMSGASSDRVALRGTVIFDMDLDWEDGYAAMAYAAIDPRAFLEVDEDRTWRLCPVWDWYRRGEPCDGIQGKGQKYKGRGWQNRMISDIVKAQQLISKGLP